MCNCMLPLHTRSKTPTEAQLYVSNSELQRDNSQTRPSTVSLKMNRSARPNSSSSKSLYGNTLAGGHLDAAAELELQKLQADTSIEARSLRAKIVKGLPTTIETKREIRRKYGATTVVASTGFKAWRFEMARKGKRTKQKLSDFLLWFEVWRSSIKEVEGKFGTAVVSYFVFLKWMMFLNIYIFLLMFLFVVIPQVALNTSSNKVDNATCVVSYENTISNVTGIQLLLDFFEGTGWMEKTALFYGFYVPSTLAITFTAHTYNLPLAYILVSISYFVLSLLLMVRYTGRGFKENLANQEDRYYKYCNKVFGSWDCSLNDTNNAYLKHSSIHYDLTSVLEEERLILKRQSRTIGKKIGLVIVRFIVNFFVLVILGGAGYLIYFTSELAVLNENESAVTSNSFASLLISYLPSIVITLLNAIIPMIFNVLVRFEEYSPQFEINLTLSRTVLLRLASLAVLIASYYPQIICEDNEKDDTCSFCSSSGLRCWETYIGQQFYKLCITDFVAVVGVVVFWEFPRKLAAKYFHFGLAKALGQMEFEIPKNVLAIVYSQAICWVGSFYSPLLPSICLLKCIIFFYLKKWSLLYNMIPSNRPYRASRSGNFFMVILLITFMLCVIPVGYSMVKVLPSRGCGPFRDLDSMWDSLVNTVDGWPLVVRKVTQFIGSVAFIVPFTIVLCLILYYYHAIASAHREMIVLLKDQLIMEGRDKHFLLMRLNKLDPGIKGGHRKAQQEKQDKIAARHRTPPKSPSGAWEKGGPDNELSSHPNIPNA
ncbi:transmembrane channel-like protein 7 isoform X2 [Anneissia japonica]|uniref:transmembrane channel-like protein 7 isoform X2 n=1 Tax=Anneissia japonica TaxID=1529436 RepID=UPI001425A445|nr:transmembrane channel-like protein 7 isoform X2 [Anneissia japonica]